MGNGFESSNVRLDSNFRVRPRETRVAWCPPGGKKKGKSIIINNSDQRVHEELRAKKAKKKPAGGYKVAESYIIEIAKKGTPQTRKYFGQFGLALADQSIQEDMVVSWLKKKYSGYPALAVNILANIPLGKKIKTGSGDGQPALMTINDTVKEKLKTDKPLKPGQNIPAKVITSAVLFRWNERNSCCMEKKYEGILEKAKHLKTEVIPNNIRMGQYFNPNLGQPITLAMLTNKN